MGIIIVVAIHVAAIAALVATLASGQILKQLKEIQASVEAQKEPPKAPPPPPPDLAKPPPPVAIVPEISIQQEAPPPVTVVKQAPPPPPAKTTAIAPTSLEPIARTHTKPPYPTISQRLGEQGTSEMQVAITTEGTVSECKITKSSGSERLDTAACEYVKGHWRWKPPSLDGKPTTANTAVSMVWNLKDAQ